MARKPFKAMLKQKAVKATAVRLRLLNLVTQAPPVFSGRDIIQLDESLDRITVRRNLQLFVREGLLLAVPNTGGVAEYCIAEGMC